MSNKYPHIKKVGSGWRIVWSGDDNDYVDYVTYSLARLDMKRGARPLRFRWNPNPDASIMESVTYSDEDLRRIFVTDSSGWVLEDTVPQQVDLNVASGVALDNLGVDILGESRRVDETDEEFRRRMLETIRGG